MSASPSQPPNSISSFKQHHALESEQARHGLVARCLRALPNLFAFFVIGSVMAFGHFTGWKMPVVADLMGSNSSVVDDWCEEHLVPESNCIECREDLKPMLPTFGFCQEHGVAECVLHHPELAQISNGQPVPPKYDTLAAIAVMNRPANNSRNTLHTKKVQFTSAASVDKAGIEVNVVQERPMTDAISANGELVFDPTRVAHLSTRVKGTVAAVFKTVGDRVAAGDVLALIDAAEVGQAKSELMQSMVQLALKKVSVERLRPIATSGAVAQKSIVEAESALHEAELSVITARQNLANLGLNLPDELGQRDPEKAADALRFLGIPTSITATLPADTQTANLIPIRASYPGVVVDSDIVAGEVVAPSSTLFTISDPSRMWLLLSIRQEDATHVRPGQAVKFVSDISNHQASGEVAWISPAVDEQTRTLQVRVVISNPDNRLLDKTFGTGTIMIREEPHAIVVPRQAVQSTSDAHFIFVRDKHYFKEDAPKFFHVRQVRMGAQDDQFVELLAGALPGEVVAVQGSSVLMAQLLRSNLGAGCGCHE